MKNGGIVVSGLIWTTIVTGCASKPDGPAFQVRVRGDATSCSIEAEGQHLTSDKLLALAKEKVRQTHSAHIDSDMGRTPYRCLSAVIFSLQRAGFANVGFISEPPTPKAESAQ